MSEKQRVSILDLTLAQLMQLEDLVAGEADHSNLLQHIGILLRTADKPVDQRDLDLLEPKRREVFENLLVPHSKIDSLKRSRSTDEAETFTAHQVDPSIRELLFSPRKITFDPLDLTIEQLERLQEVAENDVATDCGLLLRLAKRDNTAKGLGGMQQFRLIDMMSDTVQGIITNDHLQRMHKKEPYQPGTIGQLLGLSRK